MNADVIRIGLASDDDRYHRLRTLMRSYVNNVDLDFFSHRNAIPRSDVALKNLLEDWQERFDIIIIPLTFKYFGSLRIAELIHKHNSSIKTILLSSSQQLTKNLAEPLFDYYLDLNVIQGDLELLVSADGGLYMGRENFDSKIKVIANVMRHSISEALKNGKRLKDDYRIEMMISALLSTQGCFRFDPYSGRHPELAFRASIEDYKQRLYLEDQIREFPRGASQEKVNAWKNNHFNITINGANAKINIGSTDMSIAKSDDTHDIEQLVDIISRVLNENIEFSKETIEMLAKLHSMKKVDDKPFMQKYNDFIQSAANHMTILAPYIPALTSFLNK